MSLCAPEGHDACEFMICFIYMRKRAQVVGLSSFAVLDGWSLFPALLWLYVDGSTAQKYLGLSFRNITK